MKKIQECRQCNLCKNQKPLLEKIKQSDIMWVGLSAKKVSDINTSIPLQDDTNSGKIIKQIEESLPNYTFYKTNLTKCLPLDNQNKIRYPKKEEMGKCMPNLLLEINIVKPKVIFLLGKKIYDFITKYIDQNKIKIDAKIYYLEHPSYIYIYKRKYINDYINKVQNIINSVDKTTLLK